MYSHVFPIMILMLWLLDMDMGVGFFFGCGIVSIKHSQVNKKLHMCCIRIRYLDTPKIGGYLLDAGACWSHSMKHGHGHKTQI